MWGTATACCLMIVLITLISGVFTGILARKFHWNARVQNVVGALGVNFFWFISVYVFSVSPSAWTISSVGPNWANFIELLTPLLHMGFAPVIAEKNDNHSVIVGLADSLTPTSPYFSVGG
jgi:hypothetical protein